jgi:4-hydroxybenzoate polyprenyltransferase
VIPLLRASHFQPTLAVTAITTTLAVAVGRGTGAVWVALAVLAGQLSVGWSNDYLDRNRDRVAGRTDKPIVAGQVSARTVGLGAVIAAVACVPLSLMSGWRAGAVHLTAVAGAWAYNLWLKNTPASVVPFSFAFGVLPAFVTLGLPGHPWPPAWATAAAALMGTGAHFVNTLPDFAGDAATGIRGLPHRVGPRGSLLLGFLSMAAATVVLAVAPRPGADLLDSVLVVAASTAVLGVVVAGLTHRLRAAWSLTLCAAALNVAVFVARGGALTP